MKSVQEIQNIIFSYSYQIYKPSPVEGLYTYVNIETRQLKGIFSIHYIGYVLRAPSAKDLDGSLDARF